MVAQIACKIDLLIPLEILHIYFIFFNSVSFRTMQRSGVHGVEKVVAEEWSTDRPQSLSCRTSVVALGSRSANLILALD